MESATAAPTRPVLSEIDRRGHPDDRRADAGKHRQNEDERRPEGGGADPREVKRDTGQHGLDEPDDERALERGPRDRQEPVR